MCAVDEFLFNHASLPIVCTFLIEFRARFNPVKDQPTMLKCSFCANSPRYSITCSSHAKLNHTPPQSPPIDLISRLLAQWDVTNTRSITQAHNHTRTHMHTHRHTQTDTQRERERERERERQTDRQREREREKERDTHTHTHTRTHTQAFAGTFIPARPLLHTSPHTRTYTARARAYPYTLKYACTFYIHRCTCI